MKKGMLILGLGLLLIALTGCAQTATSGGTTGITTEDFVAACEEAGYTSTDESGVGAGAPSASSMKDPTGIKIGKVAVVDSARDCSDSCNICGCDGDGNNCRCQD